MRRHRPLMLELARDIVGGRLPAGHALPREVELAETLEVSRGVVREVLRALEERGLITVTHGSKNRVNPSDRWDLFDADVIAVSFDGPAAVALLAQYLECRRMAEIEAAGLAAARADAGRALVAQYEAMEAALAIRPARAQEAAYDQAAAAFHVALAEASGNAVLRSLVKRIYAALLAAGYPLARPAYRRTHALPEHEAILAGVRSRDAEAARAAMRTQLETVEGGLRDHARKVARAA